MMRKTLFGILGAVSCAIAAPLAANTVWVPMLNVLETDGDHISRPMPGSEAGLSRSECERLANAWGTDLASAQALTQHSGRAAYGMLRVTCEQR